MQCEEWDNANSELFKESHDEAVHKNSYKSRLYELISASLEANFARLAYSMRNTHTAYFITSFEPARSVGGTLDAQGRRPDSGLNPGAAGA